MNRKQKGAENIREIGREQIIQDLNTLKSKTVKNTTYQDLWVEGKAILRQNSHFKFLRYKRRNL